MRMMCEFEMLDLGKLSYFLGMEFLTIKGRIFLHQRKFTIGVLKRSNMLKCNSGTIPADTRVKIKSSGNEPAVGATM